MRYIKLSQGKVTLVDSADYKKVVQFKWYACNPGGDLWYACRTVKKGYKWATQYLHRYLLESPGGRVIDHINHNGLDNRQCNLRSVSQRSNMQNQRSNTSGFPGVSWHSRARKWQAQIRIKGKYKYLGLFSTAVEAANAYTAKVQAVEHI